MRALLPLPDGFQADEAATEPTLPKPRRLYVWPRRLALQRIEEADGRFDEAGVRLRVLYTVGAKGEPRVQRNDRAITLALDAIVPGVVAALAANRRSALGGRLHRDGRPHASGRPTSRPRLRPRRPDRGRLMDATVRFRSPRQPAHYVRAGRGFKFVGGRLA